MGWCNVVVLNVICQIVVGDGIGYCQYSFFVYGVSKVVRQFNYGSDGSYIENGFVFLGLYVFNYGVYVIVNFFDIYGVDVVEVGF